MRRRLSKGGMILLLIVVGILSLYPLTILIIHLPPVQNFLLSIIEQQINRDIQGKIEIGSFRTNLINSIALYRIRGSAPGRDSLSLEKLHVDYSFFALFDYTLHLELAGASEGSLTVVRDSAGVVHFPLLPQKRSAPVSPVESAWVFTMDSAFVEGINIEWIDIRESFTVSIQSFKSGIKPQLFDSLQTWFSARQLSVRSPWWNGVLDTLYGRGTLLDSMIKLPLFILAGNDFRIEAKGTVPLTTESQFTFSGTVEGRLEPFSVALPEQDSVKGSFSGSIEAEGTLRSPLITTRLTSSFLQYRDYIIDSVYVQVHYTQEERAQFFSFLKTYYARATIEGSAGIHKLFISPQFTGYTAYIAAVVNDLNPVMQLLSIDMAKLKGSAKIDLSLKSDSLIEVPDSASVILAVYERGTYNDIIRAHLVLDESRWQLQALAGKGNEIAGNGFVQIPQVLSGRLKGNLANPDLLSSIFLKEPIYGTLSFTSSFTDLFKTPEVRVQLRSDSLAWRGAMIRELNAVMQYDGELLIDSARLFLRADLGKMDFPELDRVDGMLEARVTAKGKLNSPRVEASVHLSDPVYQSFSADSIAMHLLYNDDMLYWDSLHAINDTVLLTSEGKLDFLLPHRSVQAGFNLEVRGLPAAGIRITGLQENDSIKAETLVDHCIPGRFVPGFPVYTCYDGVASVQAVIAKGNCLRSATMDYRFVQYAPKLNPYLISGGLQYADNALGGSVKVREQSNELSRLIIALDVNFRNAVCPGEIFRFKEGSAIRVSASNFEYGSLVKAFFPRFTASGKVESNLLMVFRAGQWNMTGAINAYADTLAYPPVHLAAAGVKIALKSQGSIDFPQGEFSIAARQITYENEPVLNLAVMGYVDAKKVRIDSLYGNFAGGGEMMISGIIPFTLRTPDTPDARFYFTLVRLPVTLTNTFLKMVTLTGGVISGEGQIDFGKKMNGRGYLDLINATFVNELCTGTAGPFTARIKLTGDSIILNRLSGEMGKGTLGGNAFVQIGSYGIHDFSVKLRLDDARFDCEMLTSLGIDNTIIHYTKRDTGYLLTGSVSLNDTRIQETITIPDVIREITGNGAPGTPASSIMKKTVVDATLVLNSNLLIDTNIGRLLLDGRIAVAGTLAQPSFNGVLQVVEGRISYLDRDFDIGEGTLRQFDPYEINPDLNITASSEVMSMGPDDPQEYMVTVTVRGTLRRPEISIISDPPLERQQIVNLLTLGRTEWSGELGTRTGEIASAQVTGLGSQFLERALNIDNISITGNIFTIPQGGGVTVTLTENITTDLSIAYQTNLSDPSNQGAIINYRLFPHFRIIAQTYTVGATDVGFRYIIRR